MSILIADSGSTKTDWVLIDKGLIMQCQSMGFNPYFQTSEEIYIEIKNLLLPVLKAHMTDISHVAYYGAGCSTPENVAIVAEGLHKAFGQIPVDVNHDLLGAARALCGKEPGVACILGTGSNSCLYNGDRITENIISVGYLFGDHGSGACMGKSFIQDYFDGRLPAPLAKAFEDAGYNRETILDNVYKKPMPSRYLAKVSTFLSRHIHDEHVRAHIRKCFSSFFDAQVSKYTNAQNLPVNSVGSIGYHYKDILTETATEKGFTIGHIIKSPIQGLIHYHQQ